MKRGKQQEIDHGRAVVVFICSLTAALLLTGPSVTRGAVTVPVERWVAHYNGNGDAYCRAEALAVDAAGNVYVTGYSDGGATGYDFATVKYDSNGNEVWVARYNELENQDDQASAVALDPVGNVYVTGCGTESGTGFAGSDYVTVKYDPDENELWVARYDEPQKGKAFATGVAVDQQGNVYVTGDTSTPSPLFDHACRTIKYDKDGNVLGIATHDTLLTDEYGSPTCGGDDCDDSNPGANPGAAEVCDDGSGVDEDCDGLINEADPDCICNDNDLDGFGDPASPACTRDKRDCEDTNPDVYPGAPEIPGNGIDDDCDPSSPSWGTPASIVGNESDKLSTTLGWALMLIIPAAIVIAWKTAREKRVRSD